MMRGCDIVEACVDAEIKIPNTENKVRAKGWPCVEVLHAAVSLVVANLCRSACAPSATGPHTHTHTTLQVQHVYCLSASESGACCGISG